MKRDNQAIEIEKIRRLHQHCEYQIEAAYLGQEEKVIIRAYIRDVGYLLSVIENQKAQRGK